MKRNSLFLILFLISIGLCKSQTLVQTVDSIPMRDGKKLAADIYLPSTPGQYPVILVQTPYNRLYYRINQPLGLGSIAGTPYALVVVDWRGYYGSASAMVANADRGKDGYDVVEWIATKSWSNGKIGTWGPSALGKIQFQTAKENPPHLVCAAPLVAGPQFNYWEYFPGGVYRTEYVQQLDNLGFGLATTLLNNPLYNTTWQYAEAINYYPQSMNVPLFMVGGWYDHNVEVMMQMFNGVQTSSPLAVRSKHKLMMGPWAHGGFGTAQVGTCNQGELTYNEACGWSDSLALRFFDFYLRDLSNGWESEPVVQYFQMGENTWQQTATWPPTGMLAIKLFFNDNNSLTPTLPTSTTASANITYDPHNPSPTIGGSTLRNDLHQGPYNQAPLVESRNDILIYTTPILTQNTVLKGSGRVHLFVSSNRPDTDFGFRLTDVYPDGRSMLLVDNIQRMRFRAGFHAADTASMQSGQIYEIDIPIHDLANTFLAGHRIRIDITSSNYPRFDNNLNNGGKMYSTGDTLTALNKVYLNNSHASFIELPLNSYIVGLNENVPQEDQFQIVPNPANESFSITNENYNEINLYNINGVKIFTQQKSERYNLNFLPAGIYFVEIISSNGIRMMKLVKM
ncbi:MAG: CocE/NonD family hydrolase [Bacteroidota bacterium]